MKELSLKTDFTEVVNLIKKSRFKAMQAVNAELINLYWQIGEYISNRVASEDWGKSVVAQLADYLQKTEPDLKGFSDKNLLRMKQFYETYRDSPKFSRLLKDISLVSQIIWR